MSKTKIEWTEKSWNPVTGCSKVSVGCKNCYAEGIAKRFWKDRKFTDVKCHEDRLEQPLHWRKPSMVFVNSMSDLFHEKVPFEFIIKVFRIMSELQTNEGHIFQILTKRPDRAKKFYDWVVPKFTNGPTDNVSNRMFARHWPLKNVWLGVSVENQETADVRIPILLQIPAAIRWVSIEPMLGSVDLTKIDYKFNGGMNVLTGFPHKREYFNKFNIPEIKNAANIDWVVLGGESGHKARPMHPEWVRKVRDDCKAAGVPFFFKQWGEWIAFSQSNTMFSERRKLKHIAINNEGKTTKITNNNFMELDFSYKVCFRQGKKYTGRLLDGREYSEYPVNGFN